jgi:hypothetical protein
MNSRKWSEPEIARALGLHESGFPPAEIATMLNRTESSVRLKILSLGYSSQRMVIDHPMDPAPATPMEFPSTEARESSVQAPDPEPDFYRLRAERELEVGKHRREEREKVEEAKREILGDRIVEEFRRHLCDLPSRIEITPPSPVPSVSAASTAPLTGILVLSDMHAGQVVDPRETEGLGVYNPAIMLARLYHLELEARRILATHNVEKLLVLFGGDILHGHLGHTLEDDLTIPIATQVDLALHMLFPFVVSLASVVPALEIHGVAGNHGRWPGMRKMPTDRRWSNLDTVLYGALSALLQQTGAGHVVFDERISSRRTIDVGAFRIQLLHGDEVRGGALCVGGMAKEVSNSTLRHVQRGSAPANYFVMGDKHFTASVPFGTGAFVVNGSFVGLDGFGMNFLPAPPSQTLFFLHPEHGKTETHEIRLDHAAPCNPLPYPLKPSLIEIINQYRHE